MRVLLFLAGSILTLSLHAQTLSTTPQYAQKW